MKMVNAVVLAAALGCAAWARVEVLDAEERAGGADSAPIALDQFYPSAGTTVPGHSIWTAAYYPQKILAFKAQPLRPDDIVFIGDSITELAGSWAGRLDLPAVKNRGISGDTVEGVLLREAEIGHFKPRAVFLLIGVNNLVQPEAEPDRVAANIRRFAVCVRLQSPATRVYVQTILPTAMPELVVKIAQTNARLRDMAAHGSFTLIDLHAPFANGQDMIRPELSADGLHLNEAGYALWTEAVQPYLRR